MHVQTTCLLTLGELQVCSTDANYQGKSLSDRINSTIWKPSGATHDFVRKPLDGGSAWDDPYAMELASNRPMGSRMQVDSVPEWLARGDMHLYQYDGAEVEKMPRRNSMVWHAGAVRNDAAIASSLVMRPDGDADAAPKPTGAASSTRSLPVRLIQQQSALHTPYKSFWQAQYCEPSVLMIY